MSAFKFLIDTNIVIGLEDNKPVDTGLTDLTRLSSANGVRLFVDEAVDDDVRHDTDRARRSGLQLLFPTIATILHTPCAI